MTAETGVSPLLECMEVCRNAVNQALDRWMPTEDDCTSQLAAAMRYVVFPGGKRIRPVLVQLACEACGASLDTALPGACAVELIHCYSLVHDDLPAMDNDDLRRGQPTCHKAFGEALAILVGDGLLTFAFEVLAQYSKTPELVASGCRELASAAGACGMVGGQADDLAECKALSLSRERLATLQSIHRRKTGALLRASVRIGADAAEAGPIEREALDGYGQKMGLMFQITDDLLDSHGEESKVGKQVGKDQGRGKLTYPSVVGEERSRQVARELCNDACSCLRPLGHRAQRLQDLAKFVLERDR